MLVYTTPHTPNPAPSTPVPQYPSYYISYSISRTPDGSNGKLLYPMSIPTPHKKHPTPHVTPPPPHSYVPHTRAYPGDYEFSFVDSCCCKLTN